MDRMILMAEELQQLIRDEAAKFPGECKDCYFGGVYWHEPDETGCNWSISTIRGPDWSGCLGRLHGFAMRLRERYNIPNPQRGFVYRDCQIVVEAIPEKHGDKNEFVASWLVMQAGELRKFGASIGTFENPGQALHAGELLARQDIDQLITEGYLR
jgi:hypothetical protein